MSVSERTSKVSSVIAALCILIYIAAISYGAVRIINSIGERRHLAETEFYDLADRASSSAVFLGFMTEEYKETIRDFLGASHTLLGVIFISGTAEYAFERFPGSGIVWTGMSPRFRTGAGFPRQPFFLPLRIDGQRNVVTVQAIYNFFDADYVISVLRLTLLAVLGALAIAFITLLFEVALKKKPARYSSDVVHDSHDTANEKTEAIFSQPSFEPAAKPAFEPADDFDDFSFPEDADDEHEPYSDPFAEVSYEDINIPNEDFSETAISVKDGNDDPRGLFSAETNIGWESYLAERLSAELHRCASFEQDLVFFAMEINKTCSHDLYLELAEEAVSAFNMRDMIFEKGERGISVILPSTALEDGMNKAEDFRKRFCAKLPELSENEIGLCIGLSSRSGRLIEAERLMLEAFTALEKAREERDSPIVAFKSDPEKYRDFVKHKQ